MRALLPLGLTLLTILAFVPLAAADPCGVAHCTAWTPGVCTWGKGACTSQDIVCVTINGEPVKCLESTCTDQGGCDFPPKTPPLCGNPCW